MWLIWLHNWTGIWHALEGEDKDLEGDWKLLVLGGFYLWPQYSDIHVIFTAAFTPMLFSAGSVAKICGFCVILRTHSLLLSHHLKCLYKKSN
jgi:hypothetical protein